MPMCARCFGASIGHMLALVLFILHLLPTFLTSSLLVAVMLADWTLQYCKILRSTNPRRFVTGILGGLGVGSVIWIALSYAVSLCVVLD